RQAPEGARARERQAEADGRRPAAREPGAAGDREGKRGDARRADARRSDARGSSRLLSSGGRAGSQGSTARPSAIDSGRQIALVLNLPQVERRQLTAYALEAVQ